MRLPMPLAAPVTRQTLLSSRFMGSFLAVGRGSWPVLAPVGIAFSSDAARGAAAWLIFRARNRSEEHTSELQSLMRISYAVFCLKKKKQSITHDSHNCDRQEQ